MTFIPFSNVLVMFFRFAGIVPIHAMICRMTGILKIISAPVPVIICPGTNSSIKEAGIQWQNSRLSYWVDAKLPIKLLTSHINNKYSRVVIPDKNCPIGNTGESE